MMVLLTVTSFCLQKHVTQPVIALQMGSAHSVMHLIAMFVFVSLDTLVMAITAIVHHYTMKQVMECHQFLIASMIPVCVHLDMSVGTKSVC
jgi:hypothetical protein